VIRLQSNALYCTNSFPEDDDFFSPCGKAGYLFCRWHSKQTLDRKLHGDLVLANEPALFNRRTEAGCLKSIQLVLESIPNGTTIKRKGKDWNPKQYILREWLANEGWHNAEDALKLTKNMNSNWSLKGVIQTFKDCARVVDNRHDKGLA